MYFTQIRLRNFGPFSDAQFEFEPNAINWVIGNNASGKTQMAGAMLAAIVGKPALSLTAGGVGPSTVALTLGEGDATETVSLQVTESSWGKPEVSKTTGALALQTLAAMADSEGQRLMIGHVRETDLETLDFDEVGALLPRELTSHPGWTELKRRRNRASYIGSGAQDSAVELIAQIVARRRVRFKLPLIVDEVFWHWPRDEHQFLLLLLREIAQDSQVFLLCPHRDGIEVDSGSLLQMSTTPSGTSLAAFNSWYETRKPNFQRSRRLKWIRGAQYPAQENRTCEFKEVKGGNAVGAIKGVVDQYAVAFLNAGLPQEGAIFWGIRDADRAIVGVELRPQECDELRRIVTERLHQIVPPIAPTAYRIDLHPVSDGSNMIDNFYVVEVRVPSIRRTLLFATGGQEVYVKTDAGKRKLSALELQQELIQRLGVDPDL
ncbi:ATP-binding protein [Burkholderia cenocepacia]|uniref:ATP-binding protein n=1 Tax=Burkholderia cenocepacia TaxID=95486 RepID=UPI001CF21B1E|nr:ATP-binding protein [Burkholderia cenocepacia]MCA8088890.1 ATP-binding protein [Burkholderia cenocepacia]